MTRKTASTINDQELDELYAELDRYADAYRKLLAHLESDRKQMIAAVDATTGDKEELRLAQSGLASGYLHAAGLAVRLFEGPDAVQRYLRDHADGQHLTVHDGPTIAEATADDRRWPLEKHGE